MAELPLAFTPVQEPIIATYNYQDVLQGTGNLVLYAGDCSGSWVLSTEQFYSRVGYTRNVGSSSSVDFDATFQNPVDIQGTALVSVPYAMDNNSGNINAGTLTPLNVWLKKVDASSTVTVLISGSDSYAYNMPAPAGSQEYFIRTWNLNINRTHFSKGEKLRLTIDTPGSSADTPLYTGHDPKGRTTLGTVDSMAWPWTTQTVLHIPVDIGD